MEKIHIEKFQIDRRYYSQDKNSPLFILESRSGKELTFKVLQRRGPDSMAKAVAKVELYRSGAQEVARVSCSTGFFDLCATTSFARGRSLSELPPEEQLLISKAIQMDRIERTRRGLDRADITTEYTINKAGLIKYKGQL